MRSFVAVLFSLLVAPTLAELIGPYNVTEIDQAEHGNLRRRACSPSVSLTKGGYGSGEQVQVILNICQSTGYEWFGIYQAGANPGSSPALNWQFTCGGQACAAPQNLGGYLFGMDANTVSIGSASWPLPNGSYVVWYHSAFGSSVSSAFTIGGGGSAAVPAPAPAPTPAATNPTTTTTTSTQSSTQNAVVRLNRPIRVACVGDSLTRGDILVNPGDDYPTQLAQMMSGASYEFYNFGVNGVTATSGLKESYNRRGELGGSFYIKPDIYLLMLGTNDMKYWDSVKGRFPSDLASIIDQARNSSPGDNPRGTRVILALPPWTWWVRRANIIRGGVIPAVYNVGASRQIQMVDMWGPTTEQRQWYTRDGLHLNRQGLGTLASIWYNAILCNQNGICEVGETCGTCPSDCFVNC